MVFSSTWTGLSPEARQICTSRVVPQARVSPSGDQHKLNTPPGWPFMRSRDLPVAGSSSLKEPS